MNLSGYGALLSMTLLFPTAPAAQMISEIPAVITAETTETIQNETESVISDMWTITESPVQAEGAPADTADDDSEGLDIRYLLFLQDFRTRINDAWTPFMEFVSSFATRYLILAVLFVYWAVNKRSGLYSIAAMCLTLGINQLVKLTACVYRPWIRDPRIVPAGDAITTATGYSFPSGHTATAAPIFGGMAVTSDKKHKWFPAVCVLGIMLIAFSRNYLGVHTPQDVFVAIVESVLCLIIRSKIFTYLDQNPAKEDVFLLAGITFSIVSLIYITFKPYPLTYVDGKLLVDPQKMMNDGYGDLAFLCAFCIGRYIERKWIRFTPTGINAKGIILCVIGMVLFVLLNNNIGAPLDQLLGSHWGHFMRRMITILYYMALYPAIIKLVMDKTGTEERKPEKSRPE